MIIANRSDVRSEEWEFLSNGEFCGVLNLGPKPGDGGEGTLTLGIEAYRLTSELKLLQTIYIMTPYSVDSAEVSPPHVTAATSGFGSYTISSGDRKLSLAKKGLLATQYEVSENGSVLTTFLPKGWTSGCWEFETSVQLELPELLFAFWLVAVSDLRGPHNFS